MPHSSNRQRSLRPGWSMLRTLAMALFLTAAAAPVTPCRAAPSKAMKALVTAADREFEAGHFARAGELYFDIYRQDPSQIVALYNAARAHQMAGNLDKGDELFRDVLAHAAIDAAIRTKTTHQLTIIAEKRSEDRAEAAAASEKSGQMAAAAGLWADALRLQPGKLSWKLRMARALHLAGKNDAARGVYDEWLQAAPADAPDRATAQGWRGEVAAGPSQRTPLQSARAGEAASATTTPVAKPEPIVVAVAEPNEASSERTLGWTLVAVSLASLGGGVAVYLAQSSDTADYERLTGIRDGSGRITGIDSAGASAMADRIDQRRVAVGGLVGIATVTAGVGTWLLTRGHAVQVAPGPGAGLALTWGY